MIENILLLGAHGQLAWELQRSLAPLGKIIVLDYPQIDLEQYYSVQSLIYRLKPDLVINATAYTDVEKAETECEKARCINALSVGEMAKATTNLGIGLIHYSTDYVFNGQKNSPYLETDTPLPLNVYGKTKLEGEQLLIENSECYWIFRTSWVYSNRSGGFVNKVLRWAHSQETVKVVSDQISSPTWCRLLAEATAFTIAIGMNNLNYWIKQTSGLYHLAGSGFCSRFEWAREIIQLDPKKETQTLHQLLEASSNEFQVNAKRPFFSALDCSRFCQTFNLALPDWKDSLALAIV